MISLQSVEVFVKYNGNSDAFARVATPKEQALLSDDVIRKIEDIVLHLSLSQSGAASAPYSRKGVREHFLSPKCSLTPFLREA